MSIEATFGGFFKPEVKSSGRKLLKQEKISLSTNSETQVQAYVRVAPPFKVILSAGGIDSPTFTATCNCPVAKKGRYCKHIWATLLAVEESEGDFLSGKKDIESMTEAPQSEDPRKQKASDYRKEQYQKQKARVKEMKKTKTSRAETQTPSYPSEVETALTYFSDNGFPMPHGPDTLILTEAKRKLSRFFHPDKGGSREESVELNKYCDLLGDFLKRQG